MLLSTFLSRLVGMYLPGKNALYLSQTLDFQLPCYVDDDITIQGEVKQKINATKTIILETKIFNDSKECLVDGIAKVTVQGDE
jgi:acyl dehydratase